MESQNNDIHKEGKQQKVNKEVFLQVLKTIKEERDIKTLENKTKVFQECSQFYSQNDMESFKQVVLQCYTQNVTLAQNVMQQVCQNYLVTQQELDDFLIQNENDPQVSEAYQSLFTTQDINLELNDMDITEEEMDEILHYAADSFDKISTELTFGKGEDAYVITLAFIACQINDKYKKNDVEFERARTFYFKRNPNKYQWYQERIQIALQKML